MESEAPYEKDSSMETSTNGTHLPVGWFLMV